MKIRGKTALMTALLVFGFLSFQLVAAQAGEQQYDQKGGPVDTWNRPLEAGFKVGEVYSPVRFMIGLALGILILHFLRSKFPKVIPMVLVRALTSVGVVLIVWDTGGIYPSGQIGSPPAPDDGYSKAPEPLGQGLFAGPYNSLGTTPLYSIPSRCCNRDSPWLHHRQFPRVFRLCRSPAEPDKGHSSPGLAAVRHPLVRDRQSAGDIYHMARLLLPDTPEYHTRYQGYPADTYRVHT